MLSTIAPELLHLIAAQLRTGTLLSLIQTSQRNRDILEPSLYQRDANSTYSEALFWAAKNAKIAEHLHASLDVPRGALKVTLSAARKALAAGACPDEGPSDSDRPIHHACRNGDEELVRLLLSTGKIKVGTPAGGLTLLGSAARSGVVAIGQLLLDAGCDPSIRGRLGITPLHIASTVSLDFTKFLVGTGRVQLDARTVDGETPFDWVAHHGNAETLSWFLESTSQTPEAINRAWKRAANRKDVEMMKVLLDRKECIPKPFTSEPDWVGSD